MKFCFSKIVLLVLGAALVVSGLSCSGGNQGETIPITTTSAKARELYIKGRELAENVRNQESIEYFEQALELDPNFAMAHLNLSFTAPSTQEFFDHFDAALALVDKVSKGERLWILGVQAAVNGDPALQQSLYEDLVAAYPKDKRAHNLLANQLFGQQKYEEALVEYEKSRTIDPDYAPNYNQIGYCYRFLDDYAAAEKALKKYIELIPDDPNPYDSYAELLLKMGKFDQALKEYQRAVGINSRFLPSHFGIATSLCMMGKYKEARDGLYEQFLRALNDGQRRTILLATAVTYACQEEYDQAMRELQDRYQIAEANADLPTEANDLNNMAGILLMTGQPDSARTLYDKAIELVEASSLADEVKHVSQIGYYANLAFAACIKGDFESARARADEYHEAISPDNFGSMQTYHAIEGLIALGTKDYERAVSELEQANLQNPIFVYYLGEAYLGAGERKTGISYISQAAHFNAVNNLNYALIMPKAERRLQELEKQAGT